MRIVLATLGLAGTGAVSAPAAASGSVGLTAQENQDDPSYAPQSLRLLTDLDAEVAREAGREARVDSPRLQLATDLDAEVRAEAARSAPLSAQWLDHVLGFGPGASLSAPGADSLPLAATAQSGSESASGTGDFEQGSWSLSASVTAASDYRYRGVSLTDRNPALQGAFEIEHASGLYAGVWGSTISQWAGAHVELDLYAGWRGTTGGIGLDFGVTGYVYPGGRGANYVELTGRTSYTLGPVEVAAGIAYAPDQSAIGGSDNLYVFAESSLGVPNTPFTLKARAGREDGALAGPSGNKWDWSLGTEVVLDRFTLGLSYVDTDENRLDDPDRLARAGIVASLTFEF